jgi:L-asparagine transporter-like permease
MTVFGGFLLLVNLFDVRSYGRFEYWFALTKVLVIMAVVVVGAVLMFGGRVHPQYVVNGGFAPAGPLAPLLAMSFGLYSFLGIEMVAISSGEARSGAEVARATRIAFITLTLVYVGAMTVLVGIMPWQSAGVAESPFVTLFKVAKIPSAGFLMNLLVLAAALSGANASLYVTSRMLFSLARSGYAPKALGNLNKHGVPLAALIASMLGIVLAIVVQFVTPEQAYLYIIGAALVGGMLAWLVSLLAHVRFRKSISPEQLRGLALRSPLGAAGSIAGFIAVIAAILLTWRVSQSRITVLSAGPYLLILSVAYWLMRKSRATQKSTGAS